MATRNEFWELYKHPLWQEKRLRIMERDGFTCVDCEETERTLNVHHGYYEKDRKPWEYEDTSLVTLCESCHKVRQELLRAVRRNLGFLTRDDLLLLLGRTNATLVRNAAGPDCDPAIPLGSIEEAWGVAEEYAIRGHEELLPFIERESVLHSELTAILREQRQPSGGG